MPLLNLFDKNGSALQSALTDDIPLNVAKIEVSFSDSYQGATSYATLMKVLDALPVKLKKITIRGFSNCKSVREYLPFLAASFNKTESLWLYEISRLEEFQSIASGLSQPNELKALSVKICNGPDSIRESGESKNNDKLRILLRGLASSSSLEKLHLGANFLYEDDLGNELISTIQGIRTLKTLSLHMRWDTENHCLLQGIFRAAVLDAQVKDLDIVCIDNGQGSNPVFDDDVWAETFRNPRCVLERFRLDVRWTEENRLSLQRIFCSAILDAKIKELLLCNANIRRPSTVDHDVWVNTLCRQNCVLEKLHLKGIKLDNNEESSEDTSNGPPPTAKNSSVQNLQIRCAKLNCTGAREILSRFQSLESLCLSDNSIQTISLFNNMLSGEDSTLQRLFLDIVDVEEDDLKSFVSRIPHMTSLRGLRLEIKNQVSSNSCVDLLEKAVLRNTSLQQVRYNHNINKLPRSRQWLYRCDKNLGVWLSLNRAGQGFLQNGSVIPSSLWPLILERAGKISYYSVWDTWERPRMTDTRVDAVYWLLREKFFVG